MIDKKRFVNALYEHVNKNKEGEKTTKKELKRMIDVVTDGIEMAVKKYGGVKITNFGNFEIRTTKERIGRNPRTLKEYQMIPRKYVKFSVGSGFKRYLEEEE